ERRDRHQPSVRRDAAALPHQPVRRGRSLRRRLLAAPPLRKEAAMNTARPLRARNACGALAAAALAGCALTACATAVQVKSMDTETWIRRETRSALDSDDLSERTTQFLRREALLDDWKRDPRQVIANLHARLLEHRERSNALVVAELAYLDAKRNRE